MKNFNDVYEALYRKHNDKLEKIRKEMLKENIVTIAIVMTIAIILTRITHQSDFIIIGFIILFFKIMLSKKGKLYKKTFKDEIIKTFVKEYDNNLDFISERGIARVTYNKGEFERYDIFNSEDLVTGTLDGIYKMNMAEVHTQDEYTDSDGDRHRTTLFHGLFAEIELDQTVLLELKLRKDKLKLFGGGEDRVKLDSSEFEKTYDVYSTDKIKAMQLLTSDIMQMFMDFKQKYKILPEITLKENKLYIRFYTGEIFEAKVMKNALDFDTLLKYYDTINFTLNITKSFIKSIKEAEI